MPLLQNMFYISKRMIAKTIPAMVNFTPLLKGLLLVLNIQKLEMTKKKRQTPKNAFSGESVSADLALCSFAILSRTRGSSFFVYFACPVVML